MPSRLIEPPPTGDIEVDAGERIAETPRGDGAGYDIASFNADASSRLIEVKTTGLGKYFPFMVTANEVRVSEREAEAYQLYRVFDFFSQPRLYVLPGSLRTSCRLEPTQYRARVGPALQGRLGWEFAGAATASGPTVRSEAPGPLWSCDTRVAVYLDRDNSRDNRAFGRRCLEREISKSLCNNR